MSDADDSAPWVAKADNDLLSNENNISAKQVPWDSVCFHAQQAAEKMLKALLVAHGSRVRRIHDLEALLGETAQHRGRHHNDSCRHEGERGRCRWWLEEAAVTNRNTLAP